MGTVYDIHSNGSKNKQHKKSETSLFQNRLMCIKLLEDKFFHITKLLYNTEITPKVLAQEVVPCLADDVYFVDPWQSGSGKERYILGMKGFHSMFHFDFDVKQLNVTLEETASSTGFVEGRVIVDGTMNLKQFKWLYVYPLRTILVYKFKAYESPAPFGMELKFEIYFHEEMWSFGDMIQNIPFVMKPYTLFRNAFASGFLAASSASLWLKGKFYGDDWK
eukprot:TRINITY_DN11877_c0_g1_i1.p1 TRINITY_DN11877_c0_g1~~TRINITY_DN11877_c0_g1_i1.p1  ORF type:complete len:220 (-),score=42.70 TRINITY_DN11877_c0_g1_i1:532-1191(-)